MGPLRQVFIHISNCRVIIKRIPSRQKKEEKKTEETIKQQNQIKKMSCLDKGSLKTLC